MGGDTVSRLLFADGFVGISETAEGLQKQTETALLIEHTRKWRVSAIVKKCAVVFGVEDKLNQVNFSWKLGEYEVPIVDQYTHLGLEVSKYCSWDTHMAKKRGRENHTWARRMRSY